MIVSWLWWELGFGQKPDQRLRKPRLMGHGLRGAELGWTTMDCVDMEGMMKHVLPNGARKRSLDVPFFEPLFKIRAIMGRPRVSFDSRRAVSDDGDSRCISTDSSFSMYKSRDNPTSYTKQ